MEQQESSQPSPPPRSTPVGRAIAAATVGARRIATNPRVRGEIGWVGIQKLGEFLLQLVTLKVLTNLLSQDTFGECRLALTGLLLIANLLIMPMQTAYLRIFHQAEDSGAARQAGLGALRWYAISTGTVCVVGAMLTLPASKWLGLEPFTVLAAGALFVSNQWRMLTLQVTNVKRDRRSATIQVIGNLLLQITLVVLLVVLWGRFATAVLIAYAVSTLFFACAFGVPLFRRILNDPGREPSRLRKTILTLGLPLGLLLTFQWVQGFADRYILATILDTDTAGLYVAAFQVLGVPFMLMWFFLDALLTPIMYQRAKNKDDPRQLWSAYRIFLGGVALYMAVGTVSVVFLGLIGQWLLITLTNESYTLPVVTIVILALARFAHCLTYLLDRVFTVNHAMTVVLILRMISAALTVPICIYLIRKYGLTGAAVASLVVTLLHVALQLVAPGACIQTMVSAHRSATRYSRDLQASKT